VDNLLSNNVKRIEISGIRKFYNKVADFPEAISLTLGQPDFNVPDKVKCAMIKAINENKTVYTSNAGIPELRKEICSYLKSFNISYNPDEICITVGGSEGLVDVFTTLLNNGDEVLIPMTAYPAYESCVKLLGGKITNYSLNESFGIDFENLAKLIKSNKPKAMVLSYPSNPTGAVLSGEDRDRLYEIIKHNDIIVITDEIYSSICFDKNYYSIAQYEDIKDKIIMINGFSKMFSMTGLRIGFVCAPQKFMTEIMKVHQYNVSCAPSISQYGALAGLKYCMDDIERMRMEFENRRDYIYNRMKSMGLYSFKPMGAFYMFPSITGFNMKSEEFCDRMLKEAGVAVVPGSAFGKGGEGYMRISYAYSKEKLIEGLDRIENWIKTFF
jgi:aminotransferase